MSLLSLPAIDMADGLYVDTAQLPSILTLNTIGNISMNICICIQI